MARTRFGLGERDLDQSVEHQHILFAQEFDAAAHVLEAVAGRLVLCLRPPLEEHRERSVHGQIMLAREPGELASVLRGASAVATYQFEHCQMMSSNRVGADMRDGCEPRLGAFEKGDRAIDFAEGP
jgi:hypothetical protein